MRGVNVSVAAGLEDFGDEEVIHRGVRAEENAAVVVERGAGVFHTAVLEVGQDHEAVLRERVGDAHHIISLRDGFGGESIALRSHFLYVLSAQCWLSLPSFRNSS